MKNRLIIGSISVLIFLCIVYSGCKKPAPYTTPPVIALRGTNPYYLSLDSTYVEYGAVANDDKDGDISGNIIITGADTIGTLQKKIYYVTYKVTNSSGFSSTVVRTVSVINNADILAGRYHESVQCLINGSYFDSAVVTVLGTNDKLTITNFGGFGNNVVISGTLQHITDTIYFAPNQSLGGGRNLLAAYGVVVNADTSFFDTTATGKNINMFFSWSVGGNKDSCSALYSK